MATYSSSSSLHPTESQILHSYLLHPSPLPTILPYKSFLNLVPKTVLSTVSSQPTILKRLYRDLQFQREINIDDVRRRIEAECRRSVEIQARLRRDVGRENLMQDRPGGITRKRKRNGDDGLVEDNITMTSGHLTGPLSNALDGPEASPRSVSRSDSDSDSDSDQDLGPEASDHKYHQQQVNLDTALHGHHGGTLRPQTWRHNHTSTSLLTALSSAEKDLEIEIAMLQEDLAGLKKDCDERVGALSDLRYGRFANSGVSGGPGVETEVTDGLEQARTALVRAS
ncbi:hypothetical protein B0A52_00178 [Exophiala mesophila]|uniref:Uncharacterized protein n=1 Tax=Exophiala mesophila TaxID=212818 RepID=A0A438NJB5_EXOME|nr:hypothetical protein B0A52_00178 [Exophiala mesophila]